MRKICFITSNVFPVPAVKGGAVETLIEHIINENEKFKKLDITCFSVFDEKALEESKKFKNTKIIFGQSYDKKRNAKKQSEKSQKISNKKLEKMISEKSSIQEKIDIISNFFKRCIEYLSIKISRISYKNYRYNKHLYSNIKDKNFDYVIIEGGDSLGYEYLIKKIRKNNNKTRIFLHMHGILRGNKKLNNIYDGFISISEFVKRELLKSGDILSDKVYMLPNGIDTENFSKKISIKEKEDLKIKFGINENDVVIMFCGRIVPGKGIKEAILALEKVRNIDRCKLLIVGNSEFAKNAESNFEKELYEISENMKNKIIFTGYIPNEELYKIHNISDVSIVPSIWDEAFGIVVIEAMTSGLPIIATDSGPIPQIAKNGCAYIVKRDKYLIENISKSIDDLIENEEKRTQMGKIGKQLSQEYSLENLYKKFCEIMSK